MYTTAQFPCRSKNSATSHLKAYNAQRCTVRELNFCFSYFPACEFVPSFHSLATSGEAGQGGTMPRPSKQKSGLVFSAFLEGYERFRASEPVKDPWETGSGAPETRLEHCAWSPSARGCWAQEAPARKRPQGALGGWVVARVSGQGPCGLARTVGPRGRCVAWGRVRGWGRLVHPRVLTAWEGRVCVA